MTINPSNPYPIGQPPGEPRGGRIPVKYQPTVLQELFGAAMITLAVLIVPIAGAFVILGGIAKGLRKLTRKA